MTTGVVQEEMLVPISPQRPNAVKTAKEDAEAVMKLLNTRQRRRDKNKKRERDSQAKKDERLLRLKQAQEDLDVVMKEAPLIVDSSAFRADMDEVEPESEFNCFECQFEPSRKDTEKRLSEWIEADEASAAAPDLVDLLRDAPSPLDGFNHIANESHDLCLQDQVIPTPVCKLIFELAVYGEPATSDAAWSLLQHLIHNPVDMTFGDRLSMLAQSQAPARTGIACGMQWFPPDEFWSKALEALGYVPPGTLPRGGADGAAMSLTTDRGNSIRVVNTHEAAPAEVFCRPAAFTRPPRHAWACRVRRLCRMMTLLETTYHAQHREPTAAPPPPFGADPALAAMLCRTAVDATLPRSRADAAAAVASYLSMHAPGDDAEWGRLYVTAVHDLRTALPSSQALVRLCRSLGGNARCGMLRQALAMVSLEAMHGGEEKVELDDVSAVPVLPVIEKLPGWRDMLRTMTPPGDEVPFGWEVLSTAEFVHMLVEPAVAAQLEAARRGQCPTDTITRTVVPLLEGLAKGLKNRRTVSVFRTRLFCSSLCSCYSDAQGALRGVAQAQLSGQGPISLLSSQ